MSNSDWLETKYGWKKNLGENRVLIRIKHNHHTAMSVEQKDLGPHGLRAHSGTEWEKANHHGYVDGCNRDYGILFPDDDLSLAYVFLPLNHEGKKPSEIRYKKGDKFWTVKPDEKSTGFYHKLHNLGPCPIEVEIEVKRLDTEIEAKQF